MAAADDRIEELLEELVAWARFANREAIVATWGRVLDDEKHLRAFELTDGTRTQGQVATGSGLSQPTVSGLWQKWRRLGLARVDPNGNVRHLARPTDLGVVVPGASPRASAPRRPSTQDEEG
jgi:hypothetical protein